jgi:hypothetical protein
MAIAAGIGENSTVIVAAASVVLLLGIIAFWP